MSNDNEISIADLSIEQGLSQCKIISFDEAVKLKMELIGLDSEIDGDDPQLLSEVEQELSKMEEDVKENGGEVIYYEFSSEFLIPEIEELHGTMTTLIVITNDEGTTSHANRHIQLVEAPITKMTSQTESFSWTHGESSVHVDMNETKALLSAVGYVTALIPLDNASIQYSNNLQIDSEFSTDML